MIMIVVINMSMVKMMASESEAESKVPAIAQCIMHPQSPRPRPEKRIVSVPWAVVISCAIDQTAVINVTPQIPGGITHKDLVSCGIIDLHKLDVVYRTIRRNSLNLVRDEIA
jgi:hypothetical protein